MVTNRKPTGRASSIPGGLAMGAVFCIAWTLLGAMLFAKLIDSGTIAETAIGYCAAGILLTGAFGGAMVSYWKIKRQRMVVCLASGAIYLLALLASTALFFGGQYSAVGVTALLILAGSGAAALLGLGRGEGRHRKAYQKIRN